MAQYQYGIVARFAEGKEVYGGQTIKTRNFAEELEAYLGKEAVYRGDTSGWQKKPMKLVKQITYALKHCDNVVILPAHNGLRVIPRLLVLLRGRRKTKLHYVVVGGWLPKFLQDKNGLTKILKKFDGIYVETRTMLAALEKQGFTNVQVLPNFKRIRVLTEDELVYATQEPYKLCTFSRVLKEKGIEDAINAVNTVNAQLGREAYALDIYGRVDDSYKAAFAEICETLPLNIRYMGAVDGARSTEIIKDYFALLFPTHYFTEGIPGTIIDGYTAGVPVIAARWESFADIVADSKTGLGYDFEDADGLQKWLLKLAAEPDIIHNMKKACLNRAMQFDPGNAMESFINNGENDAV